MNLSSTGIYVIVFKITLFSICNLLKANKIWLCLEFDFSSEKKTYYVIIITKVLKLSDTLLPQKYYPLKNFDFT